MDGSEAFSEGNDDEQVVSISEFIEGMEAQQLEADLVLGGDEGNECTYEKGFMKRQAVFSCLTCTPEGDAGFCTACSLTCHDGHEVIELWTRRGFRCDCGNEKFGAMECKLFKSKEPQNKGNVYNQNFRGQFCSCHRPSPDPEEAEQSEMLQCCICEDWFHEAHLGLSLSHQVPRDDEGEPSFDELVCPSCVERCSFLSQYPDLILPPAEVDEDPTPPSGEEEDQPSSAVSQDGSEVLTPDATPVLPSNGNPTPDLPTNGNCVDGFGSNRGSGKAPTEESTEAKLQPSGEGNVVSVRGESSNGGVVVCKLKPSSNEAVQNQLKAGEGVFLAKSWRAELCRCDACMEMYAAKGVGFLLDDEDTIEEYEETAKKKRAESQVKQEGIAVDFMKKLGHVQKMELFHGVNDMATELESFLTPFGEAGKTVTSADIYEFFEKLQQKRRRLN